MVKLRLNKLLKEQLGKIKLSEKENKDINSEIKSFLGKLKTKINSLCIKPEIFLGGSAAKKTVIKKERHDIDIFLRFDKSISEEEIANEIKKLDKIEGYDGRFVKGSRVYLNFDKDNIAFEVIPVLNIKKPEEARNVTDLSYFHVKYVLNCVNKNKKIADEIKICKAFVHSSGYYGAESYIKGFSGYSIELLMCYYKSFVKFLKEIVKVKDKLVIDPEKNYKNKRDILLNLNESKLDSPVILIDPTFKERNALAALSTETFKKFQDYCKGFLKNPSGSFFEIKKIDEEKLKEEAKKKKAEFVKIMVVTNKQKGDIAGSKLLKFYKFLIKDTDKFFEIYSKNFEYLDQDFAYYYFVLKKKNERILEGPPLKLKDAVENFKKEHKETFIKNDRVYCKEKIGFDFNQFFNKFKNENKGVMNDMGITNIKLED